MFATKRVRLAAATVAVALLGGGAAVAATTASASPAHHYAPVSLNRLNLKGFVVNAKYGEELMAWIRLRAGAAPITAESLRDFCTGKLAHYKIPRYVHITDEFPMTVTGKVRKVEMREKSVEILRLPQ